MRYKCILSGMGEIGSAVKEVFGEYHDIYPYDTKGGYDLPKGHFDILLVCFPWQENFVEIVNAYRNLHHIKATIIFSTVPIGTTRQIPDAVHCPGWNRCLLSHHHVRQPIADPSN